MKRTKKSSKLEEMLARADVEDRAVVCLEKLSPADAFATALKAETLAADAWKVEYDNMLRQGDYREVFQIVEEDFKRMREAPAFIPPGGRVHFVTLHLILRLLSCLRIDEKWHVASSIAFRMACRAILPGGFMPDGAAPALKDFIK
jgi:hypothetical protein